MNKNIIFHIAIGFLVIAVFILWFFNISLTSLPTTFPKMLEEQITELEHFTEFDYDRIEKIRIEQFFTNTDEREVLEIKDKDEIFSLLNNEIRVYNGGRFEMNSKEYDLYIHFYGIIHRYIVAEGYIKTFDGNYKVLDDNNEIFDYIDSLYSDK